jgi:glutamine amidotransferase-like uncharacterized protein
MNYLEKLDKLGKDHYVYLYAGKGTGPVSVQQAEKSFRHYLGSRSTQFISINDPSYFKNIGKITNTAACIVIPGGNADMISSVLGEEGMQGIKSLVKDKAAYIGFCAGGYLPFKQTAYTHLDQGVELPSTLEFGLDLVDHPHYGPAYPVEGSISLKTARVIPIKLADQTSLISIYWNGGGYCKDSESPYYVKRIGYYSELPGKVAIHKMENTVNPIIISEVHPEIRLSKEEIETHVPHFNKKEEYLASANDQEKLFGTICNMAGILPGQ